MQKLKGVIPEKLPKRICVGILGEVFDILGRTQKLDIRELHLRKLDWDDIIPDDLRKIWVSNFELINEIGKVTFQRAVVPSEVVNLEIKTIDTADASSDLICCAIYARFKKKDGRYSCQLILARSKVLPKDMSVPRAEFMVATLNAVTGHVVKVLLGDMQRRCWKLTDSRVALHWIGCTRSALKIWIRNRVVDINRLADSSLWRYVDSRNMCADIGTRKGAKIDDSEWIGGKEWMSGHERDFLVKTAAELVMSTVEMQEAKKESIVVGDLDGLPH